MSFVQFISEILDDLDELVSFATRVFPSVEDGFGTIQISADTAKDGRASGATDLVAVAGHPLRISFPSPRRFHAGTTITLVPPPGFEFVDGLPGVEVGAISRYWDPDFPELNTLRGIPGITILTGDGRIVWEASEDPSEAHLDLDSLVVTFGKEKPFWIQPVSGENAEEKGGEITLETTAALTTATVISRGLCEIILDPGVVSLTQSLADADPVGIDGDGVDSSELFILTMDDFGNPTERGVSGVELVREPELGDLSGPLTSLGTGTWRTWLTALSPSGEMMVSGLLNGVEPLSGRQFRIRGVDLWIDLDVSEVHPTVMDEVTLTCRVENRADSLASGVGVSFELGPDLDMGPLLSGGGVLSETSPGVWEWTELEVNAQGFFEFSFLVTVLREPVAAIVVTATLSASVMGDEGGAHRGTGRSATVEIMPSA